MITAFVYNFPHEKSSLGLMRLKAAGYNEVLCIAQDWQRLNVPPAYVRTGIRGLSHEHPKDVAKACGYEWVELAHDSQAFEKLTYEGRAVILGARILKPHVIAAFPDGIVNAHPGYLPHNRCLDNMLRAILLGIPQAVTFHLIDSRIDRGRLLYREIVDVLPDDTLIDLSVRLLNVGIHGLPKALATEPIEELGGPYRQPMTKEEQDEAVRLWPDYRANYGELVSNFMVGQCA